MVNTKKLFENIVRQKDYFKGFTNLNGAQIENELLKDIGKMYVYNVITHKQFSKAYDFIRYELDLLTK